MSLAAEVERAALSAEVWVVDNASADGSAAMVRARHPTVRLVESPVNLGFTAANNLVLNRWACGASPPDRVLALNPDTEVRPGALSRLIDALAASPRAAMAGPRLAYPDGRFQASAFRFPGLVQTWLDLFPAPRLAESRLNGRYPRALYAAGRPFPVDCVLGACMLVRATALRAVGALDTRYVMYCEEIDWCRRFADAGWRTLCVPAAEVVHHGGASTRQLPAPAFTALWRSRRLYFARHVGPIRRAAIDAVIRAGFAAQARRDRRAVAAGGLLPEVAAERAAARRAVWDPPSPAEVAAGKSDRDAGGHRLPAAPRGGAPERET